MADKAGGLKAVAAFTSQVEKSFGGQFEGNENPSPNEYDPVNDPIYMIKGRVQDNFGTDALRESLLHRDIAKSPFTNPNTLNNPDPGLYTPKDGFVKLKSDDYSINAQGLIPAGGTQNAFAQHKHQ